MKKIFIIILSAFSFIPFIAFARQVQLLQKNLISSSNLLAYWNFNGGNANDYKGNYNGTATNVTYGSTCGMFGIGGCFNQNAYITFGAPTNGATSLTLIAWADLTSIPSNSPEVGLIISTAQTDQLADEADLDVYAGGSKFRFGMRNNSGSYYEADAPMPALNTWYCYAGTYNGSIMSIYMNGILEATTSVSGITGTSNPGVIGAYSGNASPYEYYWPGYIDDVSVFNIALSASQVEDICTSRSLEGNAISR